MTSEATWQRARQPEQKEQRRAAILEAAAELFERDGFDKLSLTAIARQAGISKGNVYRYFESKEEIFLQLLHRDNAAWVSDVETRLARLGQTAGAPDGASHRPGGDLIDAVAHELAASLHAQPRLTALTAVTANILEHNVSEQVVVDYKSRLMPLFVRLGNAVHAALPGLPLEDAREFLLYLYVTQAGMWPVAHPAPVVARVLQRPSFSSMCVDWYRDLERMLAIVLRGMHARRDAG